MAYQVQDSDREQFETPAVVARAKRAYDLVMAAAIRAIAQARTIDEAFTDSQAAISVSTDDVFSGLYTWYVHEVVPWFAEDAYVDLMTQQGREEELGAGLLGYRQDPEPRSWLEAGAAWLRQHLGPSVQGIKQTTQRVVAREIANGAEAGWNPRKIARAIRKMVPQLNRVRSERWVRTEVTSLSNWGARAGATEAGGDRKAWVATPDERTRTTHRIAHKQVVPIDGKYTVGDEKADHPGDPALSAGERINCRCSQFFILSDEDEDEVLAEMVDIPEPEPEPV